MNKEEIRRESSVLIFAAGDVSLEKAELLKSQCDRKEEIDTITLGCTELLTILCC